jgi:hypothetical protein
MFSFFLALVVYSSGSTNILNMWKDQPIQAQVIIAIFYIALVYFIAFLLTAFLGPIIRIYEGYWDDLPLQMFVKCWKDYRKGSYQRKLDCLCKNIAKINKSTYELVNDEKKLNEKEESLKKENLKKLECEEKKYYRERYLNYPPCTRRESVMPTRFGNVMKSIELYPRSRYGLSSVVIWPRLYVLLLEKNSNVIELLTDARSSLESLIFISMLGLLFSALGVLYICFGLIIDIEHAGLIFLVTFWGGLAIWWVAYRGAIGSARHYGELMNTAFDLYRKDLLKALGWDKIEPNEERKYWAMANALFYRGKDYRPTYQPPKQPAEQPPKPIEAIITIKPSIITEIKKGDKT